MLLLVPAVLSLLFSCCLWEVETRSVISTLSVSNGGKWGEWGVENYCPRGYIDMFALKLPEKGKDAGDKVGAIGIRGFCTDGSLISSSVGTHRGIWSDKIPCHMKAFSLRVSEPQGLLGDNTAVNNIKFQCSDGTKLEGNGPAWGKYGEWSGTCTGGQICGIQTKVEKPKWKLRKDRTELNDVKFLCCR
ncbi:vitelline membrane outer layer protein 1-like [Paroedura picta]|uniref:vitelline membrane outer layer protein 1-like n=1 Tax=Paroedura picta TaxID=143630 RepID=UPI0040575F36